MNLLQNGNFEGGTHQWEGVSEIELPDGWTEFRWREEKISDGRPEVRVETFPLPDGEIHTVLKAFTTYRQHQYYIGQHITVHPGATYKFTARVWCWSSKHDRPAVSWAGSYRTRIGVEDGDVAIWNVEVPGTKAVDQWVEHELIFTPISGEIVVWLCGDAEWGIKHNDAYWDFVSLEMIEQPASGDLNERIENLEREIETLKQNWKGLTGYLSGIK